MLGYDDCYFVCMQFKTVPFRPVYISALPEDWYIDCNPENEIGNRWSNEMFFKKLWGRAVVACQAHNLEVGGSNPSPATKLR